MIYDDGYIPNRRNKNTKPIRYEINDNGCWICISHAKDKDGYIRIKRNSKKIFLHRWVYELHNNKKIKEGNVVMHSCDNPSCFNPEHLSEGTISDNMIDMVDKGRSPFQRLTFEKAEEIRERYSSEDIQQKELAKEYGVSETTIWDIIHNRRWVREEG